MTVTTTGSHPLTYPSEGVTGWFATWQTFAQDISDYLDDLNAVKISTIQDSNGNEALTFTTTASAVNYFDITNAATTGAPVFQAKGDDTNVGMTFTAKGTGIYTFSGTEAMFVPVGTTAQRPGSPSAGYFRYNSTTTSVEYYDGSGWVSLVASIANVVEDTTPQLGGNLDVNGNSIVSVSNGDVTIEPDGTGSINLNAADVLVEEDIVHTGDTDNKIVFGTDTQDYQTGASSRLDISNSGVRLGAANARVTTVLDEDTMSSDSATALATQQSIKAYVDSQSGGGTDWTLVSATAASGTSVAITSGLGTAGEEFLFILDGISHNSASDRPRIEFSTDAGSTYAVGIHGLTAKGSVELRGATDLDLGDNNDGNAFEYTMLLSGNKLAFPKMVWVGGADSDVSADIFIGTLNTTADIDGVRFSWASGSSFSAGTIRVYRR